MKYPCEIIRDLLPLYHDSVCAPETREAVEEHLDQCQPCQAFYQDMLQADRLDPDQPALQKERAEVKALQSLGKLLRSTRMKAALICLAVVLGLTAASLAVGAWLNSAAVVLPQDFLDLAELREGGPAGEPENRLWIFYNEKYQNYRYFKHGGVAVTPQQVDVNGDGESEWIFVCAYRHTLWEAFQFRMGWDMNDPSIVGGEDPLVATHVSTQWSDWYDYGESLPGQLGTPEMPQDPACFVEALYFFPDYSLCWSIGSMSDQEAQEAVKNHAVLLWER